jgi:hypothetical protein
MTGIVLNYDTGCRNFVLDGEAIRQYARESMKQNKKTRRAPFKMKAC